MKPRKITLDDVVTMLVTARRDPQALEDVVVGLMAGERDADARLRVLGAVCDGLINFIDDTFEQLDTLTIAGTDEPVSVALQRRIADNAAQRASRRG